VPKTEQTGREQQKNEDDCIMLHNLFCSPSVMRIMKVKGDDMATGHSTIIGSMKIHGKFSSEYFTCRDHLQGPSIRR
jgi:hypothetical protein